MKISKRQLKRIIKEEKARVLREQANRGNPNKPWDAVFPPKEATPEDQAMAGTYAEIDQMTKNNLGAKIEEAIALAQEAQAPDVVAALIQAHEALQEW